MTYHVLTVCTGNICRSPMAEYMLRQAFEEQGLGSAVDVISRGTTSWEEGEPVDPRAGSVLRTHGIDAAAHRAHQMSPGEVREADLVLALDADHLGPLRRIPGIDESRIRLLREFDPEAGQDLGIRDPWYGEDDDFDLTWDLILAAAPGIVEHVRRELQAQGESSSATGAQAADEQPARHA